MAKKNQKKKKKRGGGRTKEEDKVEVTHFCAQAGVGCYLAQRQLPAPWMLEWEDVDPSDYEGIEVPDIALDPHDSTLTVCNLEPLEKVAYVTVYLDNGVTLFDRNHQPLVPGACTNEEGITRSCITFIVLCPPTTFAHLVRVGINDGEGGADSFADVDMDSDVQPWTPHPNPEDTYEGILLGFPLECRQAETPRPDEDSDTTAVTTRAMPQEAYLCTQSEGGCLTHFFAGNLHSIDFKCPIGTPLLAVADGVVVETKTHHTRLTGIAVSNLFRWNSLLLQLTTTEDQKPLFVEYVHIQTASVKEGDVVTRGQIIGTSGSVGFSPEPHLHISAYRSRDPTASTVRIHYESKEGGKFLPQAGRWYNAQGETTAPATSK